MKTLNANQDNEMQRIIDQVPADYSNFTLDEKIELCNQGLYDLNILINELNLNVSKVLNQKEEINSTMSEIKKSIKKRDYFLITANILAALAVGFVLFVEYVL